MNKVRRVVAVLTLVTMTSAAAAASAGSDVAALPATVQSVRFPTSTESYRTFSADGSELAPSSFRVVSDSGNCCENYVASTPEGTLLDFGGTYIHFSTDDGRTWKRVKPDTPLVNGEGTVAVAPNGDILGVGWDPYTGDHLQSFKYDAAADQWLWAEQPLHTPFFDREWIAIVPGPLTIDGETVPYVSVLRGGWPSKDVYLISTDGITYTKPSAKHLDTAMTAAVTAPIEPVVDAQTDYGQTLTYTNLAPLGERSILSGREMLTGLSPSRCSTNVWLAGDDLRWTCHTPSESPAVQWHAVDSAGRLHATVWSPDGSLRYLTSGDGGRTVQEVAVPLPEDYQVLSDGHRDLKANAAAGVVAITAHARHMPTSASQDFVFVYRYADGSTPTLDRWYRIGLGDLRSGSGVTSADPRFDFSNIAILPDGRFAVSFNDSRHLKPALAIELPHEAAPMGAVADDAQVEPDVPNPPPPG